MESGDYISYNGTSPGPSTPGGASPFSHLQGGGPAAGAAGRRATLTSKPIEQADPYYRPPRPRRPTLEAVASNDSRMQEAGDIRLQPYKDSPERLNDGDTGEGSSSWQLPFTRASITPAFLRESHYSDNASDGGAPPQQPTDYAVRESDFYYGVKRGPALSSVPARKLRTGPADPVGPVESATGWFRSLLGGKRKEKGKGFEVVRSRPLGVVDEDDLDRSPPLPLEPYQDSPDADSPPGADGLNEPMYRYGEMGPVEIEHERTTLATEPPPLLGPIDTGGSLHLPSRFGSRASHVPTHPESATPAVPRRSSKRTPSMDASIPWPGQKTPSTVYESHSHGPLPAALSLQNSRQSSDDQATMPQRALADEALYLHPGSVNQPASTTRLPFGGADFAADASSAAPTPSPERGGEETRDVGPADPHFRESVTSSMYPASRGSSPIPGGEGAGLDDALSRENTMRENVMIHRDFGSAVRQAGPARSGFGDAEMLHRSIGVGEDNRRVSGFDDPVRSVRRSVGIGMDNRPVGIGMDNGPVAIGMDNRPVSTGRVGRHLASESVRDASQALRGLGGAEAEFVGGIRPPEEEEDVPPRRSRWTLDRPSR